MILDKIRKYILLFRALDRRSLFPALYVLACHAVFHLSSRRRALCERWRDREVVLSLNGMKICVNVLPGDLAFVLNVFVLREYECEPSFLPLPGDVCLDIGANIGTNTLNWYRHDPAGRIISVEPFPAAVARLRKNIALNDCRNVEIHPCAVSDRNGQIEMSADEGSSMMIVSAARESRGSSIPSVTLDRLVQTLGLQGIDLCKIDVEGHEAAVLAGAANSLPMIRRLIIEYHSDALKAAVKKLVGDGFTLVRETREGSCGLLFFANTRNTPRSSARP